MSRFKNKPRECEAVMYDGLNVDECAKFLAPLKMHTVFQNPAFLEPPTKISKETGEVIPDLKKPASRVPLALTNVGKGVTVKLPPRTYLVIEDDKLRVMADHEFEAIFEPA